MVDKVKLLIAAVILIGGGYAYYQLPDLIGQEVSILIRFAVLLVAIVVAAGVALTSAQGASFIEFSKGSRTELRKMVWPTGAETRQTTLIVLVAVVLIALFLWMIDSIVFELIYDFLLGVDD